VELTIGIDAESLAPHALRLPVGDHLLVLGPDRSARSRILEALERAWCGAHPGGGAVVTRVVDDASHIPAVDGPHLVIVGDAARVDDPSGAFTARLEAGEPGLTVFASAHADALRARFGHWTQVVRRSRRGIVLSGAAEGDGDLLGATLPSRPAIAPRPGLVWWVADGSVGQLQATVSVPAPSAAPCRLR
jgi:S-DNA-T family DNA segregation ATPase FtsK/SpoIIIE